jgi:hypothetical protein
MRHLSRVIAATVVAGALLVPASASAQLRDVTAGDAVIQPGGQTINLTLSVTCDPGFSIFGTVGNLIGRQGNTLFQGSFSGFPFPQPACTGSPQPLETTAFLFSGAIPVKNGKGTVSGSIGLGPLSGGLSIVDDFGPVNVKIRKK